MNKNKLTLCFIGLSGLSAVALGAAGAHMVKDASAAALIEKASFYQLIHTIALLTYRHENGKLACTTQLCWMLGILLFCGSLYLKAYGLTASSPFAPFGGTLLMVGWLGVFLLALSKK